MEWLFITCHNYWIVCHLVRDGHHPFLAYSPMISICDSSVPFWALLGAILSVVKKVPVEPTEFNPNMELDILLEEEDEGPLPEDDIDDGSAYSASSGGEEIENNPPNTCNRHRTSQREAKSELMVCPCLLSMSPVICLAPLFLDHLVFPKFSWILPSLDTYPPLLEQYHRQDRRGATPCWCGQATMAPWWI